MPGPLLETTRQTEIQSLKTIGGTPVFEILRQLRAELRRALSADHISLFAEPNADTVSGDIQWYSPIGGKSARLTDLKGNELVAARKKFAQLFTDIEEHAKRARESGSDADRLVADNLDLALEVPKPCENYIHVVGTQPVLAGWGHVLNGPAAPQHPLRKLAEQIRSSPETKSDSQEDAGRKRPDVEPESPPADDVTKPSSTQTFEPGGATELADTPGRFRLQISGTTLASMPVVVGRASWASSLLWLAFVLLLLLIGYLLLKNCAIGLPTPFDGWRYTLLNYCTAHSTVANGAANDDGRQSGLLDQLTDLDGQLAEKRSRCAAENPRGRDAPRNSVDVIKERGGTIGGVNVILRWQTADDLDLHIKCPDQTEINFSTRQNCGGTLDVDANVRSAIPTPAENVSWPLNAAPAGEYNVDVHRYANRSGSQESSFIVELYIDGKCVEKYPQTTGDVKKGIFKFILPYTKTEICRP